MRKRVQQACYQVCTTELCAVSPRVKRKIRIAYTSLIALGLVVGVVLVGVAQIQLKRIEEAQRRSEAPPFPVSVIPQQRVIIDNPEVDTYFVAHISARTDQPTKIAWLGRLADQLTRSKWFQQLASPVARVLVIQPGERKEQITDNIGDLLEWSDEERERFMTLVDSSVPAQNDGKYFPDRYLSHEDATPEEVAALVNEQFESEVLRRYTSDVAAQVSFDEALVIASLLEREAYDFRDMREISGIIWNRLWNDMNLQLDATLQYAKADGSYGIWWPKPLPEDKYLESAFNTYEHSGLPPTPIANPSLDAILAALNPKETECLFYFHDEYSRFHCSPTYDGHVQKLRAIYGQGR